MSFSYGTTTKDLSSVAASLAEARTQAYPGTAGTGDVNYVLSDTATAQCVRAEAVAQSFAANEPLDVGAESLQVTIGGHNPGQPGGNISVNFTHLADPVPSATADIEQVQADATAEDASRAGLDASSGYAAAAAETSDASGGAPPDSAS